MQKRRVTRVSRTKQIVRATVKQKDRAVSAAAAAAAETMKRLVPVDEGDLESTVETTDDKKGRAKISVGGQSKKSEKFVDYERDVEFGTTHATPDGGSYTVAAQPFFRPGLDAGRRELKRGMKIVEK